MPDLSEQLDAAKAALEKVSAVTSLEQLDSMIVRAQNADDYRQIMNVMSKHVFSYYGQIQEEELEKYWSKREDIVYAHGSMAYYGRENVWNYYTGMTAAMKEMGRKTAKEFYHQDFPEQYGPGYKVMNILLSPYVEIAEDRQTARGIWMAYSYMTNLDPENGQPDTSLGLSRYSCEFIREDGQWKIWHRVDHMETGLDYQPIRMGPPPNAPGGPSGPEGEHGPSQVRIQYIGQKTLKQMSDTGSPCEPSYPEPAIPEPYETWTQESSYIVVASDDYDTSKTKIV